MRIHVTRDLRDERYGEFIAERELIQEEKKKCHVTVAKVVIKIQHIPLYRGQLTKWLDPNEIIPSAIGCPSAAVWAAWVCSSHRGWYIRRIKGKIAIFNRLVEKRKEPSLP
jgi:hypothetical protein